MKPWIVLGIYIITIGVVIYLVWENRASQNILGTVLPVPTAALIGVVLFLSFGKTEPISAVISTVFLYDARTKLLLDLPDRQTAMAANWVGLPGQLYRRDPKAFSESVDFLLYHDLLQAAIVDELSTHFWSSWLPAIDPVPIGSTGMLFKVRSPGPNGGRLETAQLERLLAGNRFARIHLMKPVLTVPPKTKVVVRVPTEKNDGEIRFTKRGFFDVIIETTCVGGFPGLGRYSLFFREPQDRQQSQYKFATFTIKVTATFSGMRSGHPDMANYRSWVNAIAEVLKNGFDEEASWTRMRDIVVLRKQLDIK